MLSERASASDQDLISRNPDRNGLARRPANCKLNKVKHSAEPLSALWLWA